MELSIHTSLQLLKQTPATLSTMLSGLPETITAVNEGGNTWSPFDVIGHLIVCERTNFFPRIQLVLSDTTPKLFTPVDMQAHFSESEGKTLAALLNEFAALRENNLALLSAYNLSPEMLLLTGMHPKAGEVTLGNVLATWVAHDLTHIVQVARVMAAQYAPFVGPFRSFIGVLR